MFQSSTRPFILFVSLLLLALALLIGASAALAAPSLPQGATGDTFSLLVKADGSLWAWGNNERGQLGLGAGVYSRLTATRVGTGNDWAQIAVGNLHALGLKSDGTLWAWGQGTEGRLGLGADTSDRVVPTQVGSDSNWAYVAAGLRYSFALKADGTLWAWGPNNEGQLGTGDTDTRLTPTQVGTDSNWLMVDGGGTFESAFAAGLKTDGTLWTWGGNNHGQLGRGDKTDRLSPEQVGTDANWASICLADADVDAFKSDDTLWVWGSNSVGQLGLGSGALADVTSPTRLDGSWSFVASGDNTTFGVMADGTLWAWGDNSFGQLGQGSLDETMLRSPTQVGTQNTWTRAFSGFDHVLGLRSDGSLWAWGKNDNAQLGIGDDGVYIAPALVSYLSDTTAPSILSLTSPTHPLETVWYADPLPTFTWTASADQSNVAGYSRDFNQTAVHVPAAASEQKANGWTIPAPPAGTTRADGTWYLHVRPVDGAGNWGTTVTRAVKIDATAPVTGDDAPAGWSLVPVTVHFTASDATSGLSGGVQYKLPSGSWTTGSQVTVSGDGSHDVQYRATDMAGNVTEKTCTVKIDATAPVTTDDAPTTWSKTAVTVHLTAIDAGSGVARTQYKLDGGSWTTGTQVAISSDGLHTLAYRSTDALGTMEADKSCTVRIDTTAPVTTDDAPATWSKTAVTVHLTANDAGAGVAGTEYKLDAGAWTSGTQVTVSSEGVHALLYRSTDALGTVEADKSCTVRIDTKGPATVAPLPASVRQGRNVALKYRVNDPRPGGPTATVKITIKTLTGRTVMTKTLSNRKVNTTLSYVFRCKLAKRVYKFYVTATDTAGNRQTKTGSNRLTVR